MKEIIKKFIYNLNYKLLFKNIILMESNPDYMDNTRAVCDELIRRGINEKYKIAWLVSNLESVKNIKEKNVFFYKRSNKIRTLYLRLFSKIIIECNNYIYKLNKHQYRIYLQHGLPMKNAIKYTSRIGNIDEFISTSVFFNEKLARLYGIKQNQIIITGFPRNDWILDDSYTLELFPDIKRKKTIIWLPTFRNHKLASTNYNSFRYGIPFFNSKEDLNNINQLLINNEELLLIKLHPAEDTSKICNLDLSNIKIITDELLLKNDSNLYKILANTDALITDYSSVYFDYLLTNKQIGLAIPDIEYYNKKTGLFGLVAFIFIIYKTVKKLYEFKNTTISKLLSFILFSYLIMMIFESYDFQNYMFIFVVCYSINYLIIYSNRNVIKEKEINLN